MALNDIADDDGCGAVVVFELSGRRVQDGIEPVGIFQALYDVAVDGKVNEDNGTRTG
jgi:hypothetical protein